MEADSSIYRSNGELAESIVRKLDEYMRYMREDVEKVVYSEGFRQDPIAHIVNLMIHKATRGSSRDIVFRGFVAAKIPYFAVTINSLAYLQKIAQKHFQGSANCAEIMEYFKKSLATEIFQAALHEAVEKFNEIEKLETDICWIKLKQRVVAEYDQTDPMISFINQQALTELDVQVKQIEYNISSASFHAMKKLQAVFSIFQEAEKCQMFEISGKEVDWESLNRFYDK